MSINRLFNKLKICCFLNSDIGITELMRLGPTPFYSMSMASPPTGNCTFYDNSKKFRSVAKKIVCLWMYTIKVNSKSIK